MKPEIIIMLTHHDVTVKDAGEIFEQCKDLPVKFWGLQECRPAEGRDEEGSRSNEGSRQDHIPRGRDL